MPAQRIDLVTFGEAMVRLTLLRVLFNSRGYGERLDAQTTTPAAQRMP